MFLNGSLIPLSLIAIHAADQRGHPLDLVKVKRVVPRHRAVQSRFQIRRPRILGFVRTALIVLANAGHAGKHRFAAVYVFHGGFSEEKIDEVLKELTDN